MNNQDVTVNQMQWQPALLKLTTVPHGDVNNGEPTPCFINPLYITSIERKVVKFSKMDVEGEHWPVQTCTYVLVSHQLGYWVMESPEVIARMRDQAFGHETAKRRLEPV